MDSTTAKDPDSFPAKSVWQRMAIVAAGPMANFVFAIVALFLVLWVRAVIDVVRRGDLTVERW